jgi:hypothetical protein
MVDWFETLAARSELSAGAASELHHRGFIVLPGPELNQLSLAADGGRRDLVVVYAEVT